VVRGGHRSGHGGGNGRRSVVAGLLGAAGGCSGNEWVARGRVTRGGLCHCSDGGAGCGAGCGAVSGVSGHCAANGADYDADGERCVLAGAALFDGLARE
jgi:hypothetical protein